MMGSLMGAAALAGMLRGNLTPASSELSSGFRPIEGLRSGDQVIYEGGANIKFPKKGDVGTVYLPLMPSEIIPSENERSGGPIQRHDFTMILVGEDNEVLEYAFDSRYFKRKDA